MGMDPAYLAGADALIEFVLWLVSHDL